MLLNEHIITCHFCFKSFEIFFEIDPSFNGNNSEIFDCEVCCNPNKVNIIIREGEISSLNVSNGNE
jgi:hypothetical protein